MYGHNLWLFLLLTELPLVRWYSHARRL